jgi:hypothetical protein
MSNPTYITAVFIRIDYPEIQPEKPVDHHTETIQGYTVMPPALEVIEHASTETHTSGMVTMTFLTGDFKKRGWVSIPVKAGFLFTQTKGKRDFLNPGWSSSLS